jgi:hypothetical protein
LDILLDLGLDEARGVPDFDGLGKSLVRCGESPDGAHVDTEALGKITDWDQGWFGRWSHEPTSFGMIPQPDYLSQKVMKIKLEGDW